MTASKRLFIPGAYDRHGVARATTCCTGECEQGRHCPLTVDRVCNISSPRSGAHKRPVIGAQLAPGQVVYLQAAVHRFRPSRLRRIARGLRALVSHLASPRWY